MSPGRGVLHVAKGEGLEGSAVPAGWWQGFFSAELPTTAAQAQGLTTPKKVLTLFRVQPHSAPRLGQAQAGDISWKWVVENPDKNNIPCLSPGSPWRLVALPTDCDTANTFPASVLQPLLMGKEAAQHSQQRC